MDRELLMQVLERLQKLQRAPTETSGGAPVTLFGRLVFQLSYVGQLSRFVSVSVRPSGRRLSWVVLFQVHPALQLQGRTPWTQLRSTCATLARRSGCFFLIDNFLGGTLQPDSICFVAESRHQQGTHFLQPDVLAHITWQQSNITSLLLVTLIHVSV